MELFAELKLSDASDSMTQRILCIHKQTVVASRIIRSILNFFVGNWSPILLLTSGVSFAFTFAVHLYRESPGGSFVGIAMVRQLRGCSTTSKNLASSQDFFSRYAYFNRG
jgi:hypothetical protein